MSIEVQNLEQIKCGFCFQIIKIISKHFIFIISGHTHVLRGWLSESETRELLAIMEEKEMSLHGVLLSAAIASIGKAYALKKYD